MNETDCFYCNGTGRFKFANGDICRCTVCYGTGKNLKALNKERHQGKNKCKYCGQPCSGYACESCLDTFEKESDNEEII